MSNRKRFFLNGILLTIVGLAIRSVALGLNSLITQTVGAEGVGLFTLIGTVYSFGVTFATSGISLTVTRIISSAIGEGKTSEARGILRSSICYSLIFSIFATLVLFIGAPYFANSVLADSRCIVPLRILSVSLTPIALSSVFTGYFVGVKRVGYNAVIQVVGQAFKVFITVVLLFNLPSLDASHGATALSLSMTLTEITVFLVALVQFLIDRKKHFEKSKSKKSHFTDVTKMALPLAASAYIRSALLTLEHVLIPNRLRQRGESHSESLASYGILHGMALPMLLYPIAPLSSFAGLLVPEFSESLARGEKRRLCRVASEALNTTLCYSIAAMTFVALFSEELGYVVYNSYEAGRYIAILAPVLPIMYLDHVADAMLKGIGEQVYSMWVNISDSLLSVALVWFLIPKLGILGYAVVIVIMEGYNFILSAARLYSKIRFSIKPIKSILIPSLSAAISAYVSKCIFTRNGSMTAPVWLFLEILFAVCLFVFIYVLASAVTERKIVLLKKKDSVR